MKAAFEHLKFSVHWERNATKSKLEELITQIQEANHRDPDKDGYKCIVFVFSGNGGNGDMIVGYDDRRHSSPIDFQRCGVSLHSDIIEKLVHCESIAHIPKLFFIDA